MVNKKILIFFPKILYGGIEKNFYWLVSELLKKKIYKIDIITLNKPSTIKIKNKNLNIIQIKNFKNYEENDFFKNLKVFYLLIKFFNKTKKNYSCIISYKSHILILLLCLLYKLKIFVRISNYHGYNNYEKKIYKFIVNLIKFKIYKSFSYKVISPSKELSEELRKKFKIKSIWIPNPIQDFLIKNSKKKIKIKKNNYWNLVSVGRLSLQKNHELTIKSLSNIIKKHGIKNIRLNIIGDGELKKKLLSLINNYNLSKNVKLIKSNNPHSFLKKSDILILSSLYEGLPNILLEALCYKKIIISSACKTGPKEILLNGKYGFLVKPNNGFLLEKTILKTIKNYDYFQKKFSIDQNHLKKYYSSNIIKKYEKLIS